MNRKPSVGDAVIFHDPKGNPHNALVTTVWSETLVNVVFVSDDENRQDSYGRQIERSTSLMHASVMNVHGNYWRYADEEPRAYQAPAQT